MIVLFAQSKIEKEGPIRVWRVGRDKRSEERNLWDNRIHFDNSSFTAYLNTEHFLGSVTKKLKQNQAMKVLRQT